VGFFKRKNGHARTRLFFATDLHASEAVFRKFLNAIAVYEVNIAILGGDLTGKQIVPVVEQPNGRLIAEFAGAQLVADSEAELEAMRRRIRDAGQYPVPVDGSGYERLLESKEAVDQAFREACLAQVRDWMTRAAGGR
jgi:hypothetical protein